MDSQGGGNVCFCPVSNSAVNVQDSHACNNIDMTSERINLIFELGTIFLAYILYNTYIYIYIYTSWGTRRCTGKQSNHQSENSVTLFHPGIPCACSYQ